MSDLMPSADVVDCPPSLASTPSNRILMWWNFVARTPEEIAQARDDWEQGARRFGSVPAYLGARIPAPPLSLRVERPA